VPRWHALLSVSPRPPLSPPSDPAVLCLSADRHTESYRVTVTLGNADERDARSEGLCLIAQLSVDLIGAEHAAVAAPLASKAVKYIDNKVCNILRDS
jgi:hypothetical protein